MSAAPDEEDNSWFLNHYRHQDCPVQPSVEWDDEWSCGCDDECPACGAAISPYDSEDLSDGQSTGS